MNKKVLAGIVMLGGMAVAVPAFAQHTTGATMTTSTTTSSRVATKIACVGEAVSAREAAIDVAIATHNSAVTAAYTARATALGTAYSQTTLVAVRAGVKTAWRTFNISVRSAQKAWMTSRNAAWTTYRTAAIACKAPAGSGDGANSTSEASGN